VDRERHYALTLPDDTQIVLVYLAGTLIQDMYGPDAVPPLEVRWFDCVGNPTEAEPGRFEQLTHDLDEAYTCFPEAFEEIWPGEPRYASLFEAGRAMYQRQGVRRPNRDYPF
jgi:hypothetical protein